MKDKTFKDVIGDYTGMSVSGGFYCDDNDLTSLEGAPKYVGGYFDCGYNKLTSLEGVPEYVGGSFYCYNNNLTSLEGAPEYVGGGFSCVYNNLTSLEGIPKYIGGNFLCDNNLKGGENIYIIVNALVNGRADKGAETIKEVLLEYYKL